MQEMRLKIDEIDSVLLDALCRRMEVVADIGRWKKERGIPVRDPAREQAKLKALEASAPAAMKEYVKELYSHIFDLSCAFEEGMPSKSTAGAERNIVLIGMPGCGKSTVGRALAELLGREIVDSDAEVERLSGMRVPEIFRQLGEAEFRRMESQVLTDAGSRSGLVIATGGGSVTRGENYSILKRNGVFVWLWRELDKLAIDGRPLSCGVDIHALYECRHAFYRGFSDLRVENNDTIESAAAAVCAALGL